MTIKNIVNIPKEEKERMWLWVHAFDCFVHANLILDEMLIADIKDVRKYKNLLTAFYVTYGKPFSMNRGVGRLPTNIVPRDYLIYHEEIIEFRDQFFAHSDLNAKPNLSNDFMDNIEILIKNGKLTWQLRFYLPIESHHKVYKRLVTELITKCNYHIDKFNNKYLSKLPFPDGTYRLNLRGESEFTFTRIIVKD